MARQKEFDPEVALDKAMELFHRQGYGATSMQDLVDHMGIGRGSLYETFGSKQELFQSALGRYANRGLRPMVAQLERADQPLDMIRALFQGMARSHCDNHSRSGCLAVNTIVELSAHDPALAGVLADTWRELEDAFTVAVRRAQSNGQVSADRKPRALARFLVNTLQGLAVQAKYNPSRASMHDIVEVALSALG